MGKDIRVNNTSSIAIITPLTRKAKRWIEVNVSREGYQPYWPSLVVEARYLHDILTGMVNDGLHLE